MFNLVNNKPQSSWQWAYLLWTSRQREILSKCLSHYRRTRMTNPHFGFADAGWLSRIRIAAKHFPFMRLGIGDQKPPLCASAKHAFWVKATSMRCSHSCGGQSAGLCKFPQTGHITDGDYQTGRGGWGLEVLETSAVDKKGDPSGCW